MSEHSKYIVNRPVGGDTLVKSGRNLIYNHPGKETFWAAVDTYLIGTTWVKLMSWENNTPAMERYHQSYTTELKVTSGTEVTNTVGIGAGYEGFSLNVENSTKTFKSTETTTTLSKDQDVIVPPNSKVTFYQRRYDFRDTMFFILWAWNEEWNAGSPGGYDITRKECLVQIMSDDYLTVVEELSSDSVGSMNVQPVGRVNNEWDRKTRKRENLTGSAKDSLHKMGV
ncbi:hypothetical protein C8Q77DRAFT_1071580 [Trametes polyzona]|nr:hypothetical protein C8Q77DRAFT_1071580 [Trametes polyzona]